MKNCLIIKKFQFTSSGGPWHGMALQEKFEIFNNPNPNEFFKNRSELISKCHHIKKFLLLNDKSNE